MRPLQATIDALHRALDRATREAKLSVPNTKYMALLEKKKAATKQLIELQASSQIGTKAQTEVKALEMRCSNLEVSQVLSPHGVSLSALCGTVLRTLCRAESPRGRLTCAFSCFRAGVQCCPSAPAQGDKGRPRRGEAVRRRRAAQGCAGSTAVERHTGARSRRSLLPSLLDLGNT